jgi:molybdopterin-guanine dinucleotide biosynthesis protein A
MGGMDKGLIAFHGQPMIAHVIKQLLPQVTHLVINANRNIETYRELGYPVIQDDIPDFAGPLAGIKQGLQELSDDYLLTVPCDTPYLPVDLAATLLDALINQQAEAAIASTLEHTQPVFGLYRKSVLPSLAHYLANGGHKVEIWQRSLNSVFVKFDDLDAFANINSHAELSIMENDINRYDTGQ